MTCTTALSRTTHASDADAELRPDHVEFESVLRQVAHLLHTPAYSARLCLADASDVLQVVFRRVGGYGRLPTFAARRREAIASRRPVLVRSGQRLDGAVAIFPLLRGEHVLGVLEIAAPLDSIGERLDELQAVAARIGGNTTREDIGDAITELRDPAAIVAVVLRALNRALSPDDAVRLVVRACRSQLGTPVAGWLRRDRGGQFALLETRGIRPDIRWTLTWPGAVIDDPATLVGAGRAVLGDVQALVASGGEAVVLVQDAPDAASGFLASVETGLGLVLDRFALEGSLERLVESVDEGLAWTAHEIRGPVLGAEKVMESLAARDSMSDRDRQSLAGAQADLRRLAGTVDDLLRWSSGVATIRCRWIDLSELVGEIARAADTGELGRPISFEAPPRLMVNADPVLMRIAVDNLVRNSLQHGDGAVRVTLEPEANEAIISVSDEAPGPLIATKASAVVGPIGRVGGRTPDGHGLGLFIAQRAVQAHGGELWLEPGPRGSVFRLRVPVGVA